MHLLVFQLVKFVFVKLIYIYIFISNFSICLLTLIYQWQKKNTMFFHSFMRKILLKKSFWKKICENDHNMQLYIRRIMIWKCNINSRKMKKGVHIEKLVQWLSNIFLVPLQFIYCWNYKLILLQLCNKY